MEKGGARQAGREAEGRKRQRERQGRQRGMQGRQKKRARQAVFTHQ
jgi:hypothetical protein